MEAESCGKAMSEQYYVDMLRRVLLDAVGRFEYVTHALTSGGLDSSIATCLLCLRRRCKDLKGVVVGLKGEGPPDIHYAKILASRLGINVIQVSIDVDEALKAIENVVRILATFDPMEVVNSAAVFIALKTIKDDGGLSVITGDGGDELFAGYSYMHRMSYSELEEYIRKLTKTWRFSSIELGKYLGLEVYSPFLDSKVVELALKIPARLKVVKVNGKVIGKYILRIAFKDILPPEIVWREKHPIEYGSRFNKLYRVLEELSKDIVYENIRFWSKAQPYLYSIFRRYHKIKPPEKGEKKCPYCNSGIPKDKRYCKTCGAYPVD